MTKVKELSRGQKCQITKAVGISSGTTCVTKNSLAQSQYHIYSGNVYLGKERHSWCDQCFQFGCIRDILNSREVGDMVSVPGKEVAKEKEPVIVGQQGVISARIYHSKLVDPPA